MSVRPSDWSALGLTADPTPGDADALTAAAAALGAVAQATDTIQRALTQILGTASSGNFTGLTAQALRGQLSSRFIRFMHDANAAFDAAHGALNTYVGQLQGYQATVDSLLFKAQSSGLPATDPQIQAWAGQAHEVGQEASGAADTAAKAIEAVAHGTEPISGWQQFWDALGWIAVILILPAIIFGGPLALLAFGVNLALFVHAAVQFGEGRIGVGAFLLSFLGIIAPDTEGLDLAGLLNALGKGLSDAAHGAFSLVDGSLTGLVGLARSFDAASLFSLDTLIALGSFVPKAGLFVFDGVKALPTLLADGSLAAGRGLAQVLGKLGAEVVEDVKTGAFVSLFLPLKAGEIKALGFAGAFRLGVLERGLGLSEDPALALKMVAFKGLRAADGGVKAWSLSSAEFFKSDPLHSGLFTPHAPDTVFSFGADGSVHATTALAPVNAPGHLTGQPFVDSLGANGAVGGADGVVRLDSGALRGALPGPLATVPDGFSVLGPAAHDALGGLNVGGAPQFAHTGFAGGLDAAGFQGASFAPVGRSLDTAGLTAGARGAQAHAGSVLDLRNPVEISQVFHGGAVVAHMDDFSLVIKSAAPGLETAAGGVVAAGHLPALARVADHVGRPSQAPAGLVAGLDRIRPAPGVVRSDAAAALAAAGVPAEALPGALVHGGLADAAVRLENPAAVHLAGLKSVDGLAAESVHGTAPAATSSDLLNHVPAHAGESAGFDHAFQAAPPTARPHASDGSAQPAVAHDPGAVPAHPAPNPQNAGVPGVLPAERVAVRPTPAPRTTVHGVDAGRAGRTSGLGHAPEDRALADLPPVERIPASPEERWNAARRDVVRDIGERFEYESALSRTLRDAEFGFHEALPDQALAEAVVLKTQARFEQGVTAAFAERFGTPWNGFDRAIDHTAAFRPRLESLVRDLKARFAREIAIESARDDFEHVFAAHPAVLDHTSLLGSGAHADLHAARDAAWERFEPSVREGLDQVAVPQTGDLRTALGERISDLMGGAGDHIAVRLRLRDELARGRDLTDTLRVDAYGHAAAHTRPPALDGIWESVHQDVAQRITRDFERVRDSDGARLPDGEPPLDAATLTAFVHERLTDGVVSYEVIERFDNAVAARVERRAALGLDGAGVSPEGLDRVRQQFLDDTRSAVARRFAASISDDADRVGSRTPAEGDATALDGDHALTRVELAHDLARWRDTANEVTRGAVTRLDARIDHELGFENARLRVRRDFDDVVEDWSRPDDLVGGADLPPDAVERVWHDIDDALHIWYDKIHLADPGQWAAAGGSRAMWSSAVDELLRTAPTRLDLEQGAVGALNDAAGRFHALDSSYTVPADRSQALAERFRSETALRYHDIFNRNNRDVEAWLRREQESGDRFGSSLAARRASSEHASRPPSLEQPDAPVRANSAEAGHEGAPPVGGGPADGPVAAPVAGDGLTVRPTDAAGADEVLASAQLTAQRTSHATETATAADRADRPRAADTATQGPAIPRPDFAADFDRAVEGSGLSAQEPERLARLRVDAQLEWEQRYADAERSAQHEFSLLPQIPARRFRQYHQQFMRTLPQRLDYLKARDLARVQIDTQTQAVAAQWSEQEIAPAIVEQARRSLVSAADRAFERSHGIMVSHGLSANTRTWESSLRTLIESADARIALHTQHTHILDSLGAAQSEHQRLWAGSRFADWEREHLQAAGGELAEQVRIEFERRISLLDHAVNQSPGNPASVPGFAQGVARRLDETVRAWRVRVDTSDAVRAAVTAIGRDAVAASRGAAAAQDAHRAEPAAAISDEVFAREYPWITRINPNYSEGGQFATNCVVTAIATDLTLEDALRGDDPALATPFQASPAAVSAPEVRERYRDRRPTDVSGYQAIARAMRQAGRGARGIVIVRGAGERLDHAFNVVHDRNGVVFLDGQRGARADLAEPFELLQFLSTSEGVPVSVPQAAAGAVPAELGAVGLEAETRVKVLLPVNFSQEQAWALGPLVENDDVRIVLDRSDKVWILELVTKPITVLDGETGWRSRRSVSDAVDDVMARLSNPKFGSSLAALFEGSGYEVDEFARRITVVRPQASPSRHLFMHTTAGIPAAGIYAFLNSVMENGPREYLAVTPPRSAVFAKDNLILGLRFGDAIASSYVDYRAAQVAPDHPFAVPVLAHDPAAESLRGFAALVYTQAAAQVEQGLGFPHLPHRVLPKNLLFAASRTQMSAVRDALPIRVREYIGSNYDAIEQEFVRTILLNDVYASRFEGAERGDIINRINSLKVGLGRSHTVGDYVRAAFLPGPGIDQNQALEVRTHFTSLDTHAPIPLVVLELRRFANLHGDLAGMWENFEIAGTETRRIYDAVADHTERFGALDRQVGDIARLAAGARGPSLVTAAVAAMDVLARDDSIWITGLDSASSRSPRAARLVEKLTHYLEGAAGADAGALAALVQLDERLAVAANGAIGRGVGRQARDDVRRVLAHSAVEVPFSERSKALAAPQGEQLRRLAPVLVHLAAMARERSAGLVVHVEGGGNGLFSSTETGRRRAEAVREGIVAHVEQHPQAAQAGQSIEFSIDVRGRGGSRAPQAVRDRRSAMVWWEPTAATSAVRSSGRRGIGGDLDVADQIGGPVDAGAVVNGMQDGHAGHGTLAAGPPALPDDVFVREYPWLRRINPLFASGGQFTTNCVVAAIATDLTLQDALRRENPRSATPFQASPSEMSDPDVRAAYREREPVDVASFDAVASAMLRAGRGARGIVFSRRAGAETDHAFNVVHDRNGVVFLDGQRGVQANLSGPFELLQFLSTSEAFAPQPPSVAGAVPGRVGAVTDEAVVELEKSLAHVLPANDGVTDCVLRLEKILSLWFRDAGASQDDIAVDAREPERALAARTGGVWRPLTGSLAPVIARVAQLGTGAAALLLTAPPDRVARGGGRLNARHAFALRHEGYSPDGEPQMYWVDAQRRSGDRVRRIAQAPATAAVDVRVIVVDAHGRAVQDPFGDTLPEAGYGSALAEPSGHKRYGSGGGEWESKFVVLLAPEHADYTEPLKLATDRATGLALVTDNIRDVYELDGQYFTSLSPAQRARRSLRRLGNGKIVEWVGPATSSGRDDRQRPDRTALYARLRQLMQQLADAASQGPVDITSVFPQGIDFQFGPGEVSVVLPRNITPDVQQMRFITHLTEGAPVATLQDLLGYIAEQSEVSAAYPMAKQHLVDGLAVGQRVAADFIEATMTGYPMRLDAVAAFRHLETVSSIESSIAVAYSQFAALAHWRVGQNNGLNKNFTAVILRTDLAKLRARLPQQVRRFFDDSELDIKERMVERVWRRIGALDEQNGRVGRSGVLGLRPHEIFKDDTWTLGQYVDNLLLPEEYARYIGQSMAFPTEAELSELDDKGAYAHDPLALVEARKLGGGNLTLEQSAVYQQDLARVAESARIRAHHMRNPVPGTPAAWIPDHVRAQTVFEWTEDRTLADEVLRVLAQIPRVADPSATAFGGVQWFVADLARLGQRDASDAAAQRVRSGLLEIERLTLLGLPEAHRNSAGTQEWVMRVRALAGRLGAAEIPVYAANTDDSMENGLERLLADERITRNPHHLQVLTAAAERRGLLASGESDASVDPPADQVHGSSGHRAAGKQRIVLRPAPAAAVPSAANTAGHLRLARRTQAMLDTLLNTGERTWFARSKKSQPVRLSGLLPEQALWWRLYINPVDHDQALKRSAADPGTLYDDQRSAGYQQAMLNAYREFLVDRPIPIRDLRWGSYRRMHEFATRGVRGAFTAEGGTEERSALYQSVYAEPDKSALSRIVNGRPLMLSAEDFLADPDRKPYVVYTVEGEGAYVARTMYGHSDVEPAVDAVFDDFRADLRIARSDYQRLTAIGRMIRDLHVLHVFRDGNGRVNVFLLLPMVLMEYGFSPTIGTSAVGARIAKTMSALFSGAFSPEQTAAALYFGQLGREDDDGVAARDDADQTREPPEAQDDPIAAASQAGGLSAAGLSQAAREAIVAGDLRLASTLIETEHPDAGGAEAVTARHDVDRASIGR